jgi:hypothetical protein
MRFLRGGSLHTKLDQQITWELAQIAHCSIKWPMRSRLSILYITDSEHLAGTHPYLSREQIRFEPLSLQSDIYSLGNHALRDADR